MDLDEIVRSKRSLLFDTSSLISSDKPLKSRAYIVTPVKPEHEEPSDSQITQFEPDSRVARQIEQDKQEITSVPNMSDSDVESKKHLKYKRYSSDQSISELQPPRPPIPSDRNDRIGSNESNVGMKSFLPQFKPIPKSYKDTINISKLGRERRLTVIEKAPEIQNQLGATYSAPSPDNNKDTDEYSFGTPSNDYTIRNREVSDQQNDKEGIYVVNRRSSFGLTSSSESGEIHVQPPIRASAGTPDNKPSPNTPRSVQVSSPSVGMPGDPQNIPGIKESSLSSFDDATNESSLESGSVIDHDFEPEFHYPGKDRKN
ncbi:hypothetical protein RF11_09152 [Thelohanellus kitauei]|uniref:Uncharacterized protein n=1 Tax=Thelohanellus kitauei TaxID=669202 RepID=A0A0C2JP74_THEKT|nr:hypothetical protein RF11_09152 [Thelohanellus kitauei]